MLKCNIYFFVRMNDLSAARDYQHRKNVEIRHLIPFFDLIT